MSMTRPSAKAIRKEYERTQSLFGIPEESGWSIPVPATHAETTRANVHAAFYMCQSAENKDIEPAPTPEVEFHDDDFQYGYFPSQDRADTMMSDEGRGDGIGDLVSKLDSLDDFFEDSLQSPTSDGRSSRTITEAGFAAEGFESGAQLYDEQTLPILHQSLAQPSTNVSLQNGFADMRPTQPAHFQSNAMNPGAFNMPINPSRPSLHARSVTSPSTSAITKPFPPHSHNHTNTSNIKNPTPTYLSDDDYAEEVFSDGDEDRATTQAEGSFFLEKMIKPLGVGARSGVRRLTGGRSRDNERLRDNLRAERRGLSQPPRSPRVPRVPSVYLKGPTSHPGDAI